MPLIGKYNPDWAIVKKEGLHGEQEKMHLVREAKGTTDKNQLRPSEWAKIQFGQRHFDALDVDYGWISNANEV